MWEQLYGSELILYVENMIKHTIKIYANCHTYTWWRMHPEFIFWLYRSVPVVIKYREGEGRVVKSPPSSQGEVALMKMSHVKTTVSHVNCISSRVVGDFTCKQPF